MKLGTYARVSTILISFRNIYMNPAKIQVKVGTVEFVGEGDQQWLADQLDKLLLQFRDLVKLEAISGFGANDSVQDSAVGKSSKKVGNLASFLKEKNATTVQTRKFLAAASHIQLNGKTRQTTADVTKVLKDANQSRLGNASDCLNQNVAKGFCEKDGSSFFVTEEGLKEIGLND